MKHFFDKTRFLKCKLRKDHEGNGSRKFASTVICTDFFKFAVKKQERAKDGKGCRNWNGGLRSLILTLGGDRIPWKVVYFCLHRRSTLAGMISMRAIRATLARFKCFCACILLSSATGTFPVEQKVINQCQHKGALYRLKQKTVAPKTQLAQSFSSVVSLF